MDRSTRSTGDAAAAEGKTAIVIGGSDGIGLALVRRLIDGGWRVEGISRSESPVEHDRHHHTVCDVRDEGFAAVVSAAAERLGRVDACIYCAGIGEAVDLADLAGEAAVFEVNLLGLVTTAQVMIPRMLAAGAGHLVGLSSQADAIRDPGAPSYAASKAGMSSYLEGLALACRGRGVHVSNVRFGFVATKMARSEVRPFEIPAERAAALVERCLRRRPVRFTYPRRMALLLWFLRIGQRLRIWWG